MVSIWHQPSCGPVGVGNSRVQCITANLWTQILYLMLGQSVWIQVHWIGTSSLRCVLYFQMRKDCPNIIWISAVWNPYSSVTIILVQALHVNALIQGSFARLRFLQILHTCSHYIVVGCVLILLYVILVWRGNRLYMGGSHSFIHIPILVF